MQSNTDLYSYLEQIDHPRYTVFLSVKGDASGAWNDDLQQKLEALGLTGDLWQADASYYAIISEGEVVAEETGKQRLQRAGAVQGGLLRYEICLLYTSGKSCSSFLLTQYIGLPYGGVACLKVQIADRKKLFCHSAIVCAISPEAGVAP